MLNRIIRIMATAAACALLLAGCSLRLDDPAQIAGGSISFNAGSALLLDDAKLTKTGTLKTGTSFTTGDLNANGINEVALMNGNTAASKCLAYAQITPSVNVASADSLQIDWQITVSGS